MKNKLVILGFGYCAQHLVQQLSFENIEITGTSRNQAVRDIWQAKSVHLVDFDATNSAPLFSDATHVLISTPPDVDGDPSWRIFGEAIIEILPSLKWLGYLSTTGVYGDHQGAWVDENSETKPTEPRSLIRLQCEQTWLALWQRYQAPVHIFRLAGIYGPGRSSLDRIQQGQTTTVVKPGHYFSRIHVKDIAGILYASMHASTPGEIFNLADDFPAPSFDVDCFAAQLLNKPNPVPVPYEQAILSPMAKSFYQANRRVRNFKVKQMLNYAFLFPTYKEGLSEIVREVQST